MLTYTQKVKDNTPRIQQVKLNMEKSNIETKYIEDRNTFGENVKTGK